MKGIHEKVKAVRRLACGSGSQGHINPRIGKVEESGDEERKERKKKDILECPDLALVI